MAPKTGCNINSVLIITANHNQGDGGPRGDLMVVD